jgi:pimeloyl-ACP methyl ester carboxylesterase
MTCRPHEAQAIPPSSQEILMSTSDITPTGATPTVVLVHGAFVDASSWNGVIAELKAAGLDVVAPPNLLRGVGVDAAYLTGFVEALGRPAVLVGHSYAGAVISQAGSDASNVTGLVYVAAYAPEAGETLTAINARYPAVPLSAALRTFTYTDDRGEQATDTHVDGALFHDAVCAEAPADVADTLARTQRPASLAAFATAVTGTPAWKTLPCWAVVAAADHAIHPHAERDMAKRAGSEITEIDASHAVPATHPADVAAVIVRAVRAIR